MFVGPPLDVERGCTSLVESPKFEVDLRTMLSSGGTSTTCSLEDEFGDSHRCLEEVSEVELLENPYGEPGPLM